MANVMFKRGTHAALKQLQSYVDGCFYLTTDTDRLYVAQSSSELVELNKSIQTVATAAQLPSSGVEVGQFYYITGPDATTDNAAATNGTGGNILAVCVSTGNGSPQWVQVNPDTNTDTHLTAATVTVGSYSNGSIPCTFEYTNSDINGTASTVPVAATLNIPVSTILSYGDVDVSQSIADNQAVVTTKFVNNAGSTPTLSTGESFTIKGGSNIAITEDNGAIKITASVGAGDIALDVDDSAAGSVVVKAQVSQEDSGDALKLTGANGITITNTDLMSTDQTPRKIGTISTIGHSTSAATLTRSSATPVFGATLNVIDDISYDAYGHVTSASATTITLPKPELKKIEAANNGALTVSFVDGDGTEYNSKTSGSILYNTISTASTFGGTVTAATVYNQGDLGTFYTKEAIDGMMRTIDAMTYKGVLGATIPASASNGDVYILGQDLGDYKQGNLLIASGTEGSDGQISGTITWTEVQSNHETDTTYVHRIVNGSNANSASIGLKKLNDGSFAGNAISSDGVVTLSAVTGSADDTTPGSITLGHATSSVTAGTYGANNSATAGEGDVINIPQFTVDAYGHITAASAASITLPGSHSLSTDTTNKVVSLKNSGGADQGNVAFVGSNLVDIAASGTASAATLTFSHGTPTMSTPTTSAATVYASSSTPANREFTVIDSISKDSYGHVIGYNTKTVSMDQVSYSLSTQTMSVSNNVASTSISLKDASGNDAGSFDFAIGSASETIKVTNSSAHNINLEIEWGSF